MNNEQQADGSGHARAGPAVLDPFTGERVLEVGRSFAAGVEYGF